MCTGDMDGVDLPNRLDESSHLSIFHFVEDAIVANSHMQPVQKDRRSGFRFDFKLVGMMSAYDSSTLYTEDAYFLEERIGFLKRQYKIQVPFRIPEL
jgi:hypothetical protein